MIQVGLDHAAQCLALQTPREYVQQLASASEALTRARLAGSKGGGGEARDLLEELRAAINGPEVEAESVEADA